MVTKYLPKLHESNFIPTKDDREYAQAFGDIAVAIENSTDAERLTLRLSTCRNGFLTVNALFVDLQALLGHGSMPSLSSRAIEHLRRREPSKVNALLDSMRMALDTFRQKRDVWNRREALDQELDRCLKLPTVPIVCRDRIKSILYDVRTEKQGAGQSWDPKYYRLSTHETGVVREWLGFLDRTCAVIEAIADVARQISDLPTEDSLFSSTVQDAWQRIYSQVVTHAQTLGFAPSGVQQPTMVSWAEDNGDLIRLGPEFPERAQAARCIASLIEQLSRAEREAYTRLADRFRPNLGLAPLPEPFKIDLTEREPSSPHSDRSRLLTETIRFGQTAPKQVWVALPDFGIPLDLYHGKHKRYADDDKRTQATTLAEAAIRVAAKNNASVIVCPEYFLPRDNARNLADQSSNLGLVFIGGQEADTSRDAEPLLINEVLIRVPGVGRTFEQFKERASVYESPLEREGQLKVFHGTNIGTFAVLVCSDILEMDLVYAVGNAPHKIDLLFVCALNPHPDLFERLAIADATRLYCHVVIANNCASEKEKHIASAVGSLVCSPRRPLAQMVQSRGPRFPLGLPAVGGQETALRIYELSLEDLDRNRRKPSEGYLPVPHYRVGSGSAAEHLR